MEHRKGVLLVNIGSPLALTKASVAAYLRRFLTDPRVVDIPAFLRVLLVYLIILPFRTSKSLHAYKKIWSSKGSPLVIYLNELSALTQEALGPTFCVEPATSYSNPQLKEAVQKLLNQSVKEIVVVPLYPQYSSAANGSALEEASRYLTSQHNVPGIKSIPYFYDHPYFLDAYASLINKSIESHKPDFILFSYHGLPERQVKKSGAPGHCLRQSACCEAITSENHFCYRAQCMATTRGLLQRLPWETEKSATSFQSRLGRSPWISPATPQKLRELFDAGVRRIAVVCPSFVADCLETLEEIGIRAREEWIAWGGEDLILIPALNAEPQWVQALAQLIREQ